MLWRRQPQNPHLTTQQSATEQALCARLDGAGDKTGEWSLPSWSLFQQGRPQYLFAALETSSLGPAGKNSSLFHSPAGSKRPLTSRRSAWNILPVLQWLQPPLEFVRHRQLSDASCFRVAITACTLASIKQCNAYPLGLSRGLNKFTFVTCLEQCLTHNDAIKCFVKLKVPHPAQERNASVLPPDG